jgi:hypothetical protein
MPITPYFENIADAIEKHLQTAEREILVAVAWFTNSKLLHALAERAQFGCKVCVIVSDDQINAAYFDEDLLRACGAKVYKKDLGQGDAIMHHKFCVIDRHTLITGSYNWSVKAEHNDENIIISTGDSITAALFVQEFENILQALGSTVQESLVVSPLLAYLRSRIKVLNAEIELLETAIINAKEIISRFELRYMIELGSLISELVHLEAKKAKEKAELTQKQQDKKAYQEAQKYAENYADSYRTAKATNIPPQVAPEIESEVNRLYRTAILKAHPDRFHNQLEKAERAHQVMIQLDKARKNKDIAALQQIIADIDNNIAFNDVPSTTDITELQNTVSFLEEKTKILRKELSTWQSHKNYLIATKPEDWQVFFDQQKQEIIKKIKSLS